MGKIFLFIGLKCGSVLRTAYKDRKKKSNKKVGSWHIFRTRVLISDVLYETKWSNETKLCKGWSLNRKLLWDIRLEVFGCAFLDWKDLP